MFVCQSGGLEAPGHLGFKLHSLSRDRMRDGQEKCMESYPSFDFALSAIFPVANDRASEVCKMDTYLVLSAGFNVDLQKGKVRKFPDYFIMGDCEFCVW